MSSEIEAIARRQAEIGAARATARFPHVDPRNPFDPRADYLRRAGVVSRGVPSVIITYQEAEVEAESYLAKIDRELIALGETVGGNPVSVAAGEALKAIRREDLARTRIILPRSTT